MDEKSTPPGEPKPVVATPVVVPVVPVVSGEGVAEQYVAQELAKARASLRNVQIVAIIGLVVLALYMGYMTSRVVNYANPDVAAEVASGIISERVNTSAAGIADQFKASIPGAIAGLPDQAIKQLPEMRENLVAQIESSLNRQCQSSSEDLGKHFDEFLTTNKDQLKTVFEVGQDREAIHKLGPALEHELMAYLQTPPEGGGESVKTQLDKALAMLKDMKGKTHRLATATDLTPDELKTRRAIALISHSIDKQLHGVNVQKIVLDHMSAPPTSDEPEGEATAAPGAPPKPGASPANAAPKPAASPASAEAPKPSAAPSSTEAPKPAASPAKP